MILAAGRGERLRPLTDRTPKPLVMIGNKPLLGHQLQWLHDAGIKEVVVNVHHLAGQIRQAIGTGSDFGVRVQYSVEKELLDTGGGIKNALGQLGDGPFVVLNGDIWTDFPFATLRGLQPKSAHLVLTPTPPEKPTADFYLDQGYVRRGDANNLTYCGIAVLTPGLFDDAPHGAFSLRDLYFAEAQAGTLRGEVLSGTWIDIGTPGQLQRARQLVA